MSTYRNSGAAREIVSDENLNIDEGLLLVAPVEDDGRGHPPPICRHNLELLSRFSPVFLGEWAKTHYRPSPKRTGCADPRLSQERLRRSSFSLFEPLPPPSIPGAISPLECWKDKA